MFLKTKHKSTLQPSLHIFIYDESMYCVSIDL